MNVKLTKTQKVKIANAQDVFTIMQNVLLRENKLGRAKEHFWVVCLGTAHQILLVELVSLGSLNVVALKPVDIFALALQKQSVKIIMVHNHPSGNLAPSNSDI